MKGKCEIIKVCTKEYSNSTTDQLDTKCYSIFIDYWITRHMLTEFDLIYFYNIWVLFLDNRFHQQVKYAYIKYIAKRFSALCIKYPVHYIPLLYPLYVGC